MTDEKKIRPMNDHSPLPGNVSLQPLIQHVMKGKPLDDRQMTVAMEMIMTGAASHVEIASFLTALSIKGETPEELVAAAAVMRRHARRLPASCGICVDTCGTGGDGGRTFNVSTAAAIVAAAAGIRVLKHGNRSVSSQCGSADVLEALQIDIHQTPDEAARLVNRKGMAFLYAPDYHQSMKHAAPVRKGLGFRTIFNILGPLVNPGAPARQVVGVYDVNLLEPMAQALMALGLQRALVVCGEDGLDELTTTGTSHVCEVGDGQLRRYTITPEMMGLKRSRADEITGGDAAYNARIIREVFQGTQPAARDLIALNAGAVIYVVGRSDSLQEGVRKALQVLADGRALAKLRELAEDSRTSGSAERGASAC